MNSTKFSSHARLVRSTSAAALGIALMVAAQPVFAQDAGNAAAEEPTEGEIVVTGFRASLEDAVNEKKRSDQIIESVTAEDIGKLPDASIAESIARLPGLTSQRLNGRANVISIRGLGPDLSTTLLNGREQTSTGDSRAVEFDQYPSEIVNQVVVYKSPVASLIGQGLAGTIDIRTIRPLEADRQILAVGARGSYTDLGALNAGSNDTGYRVNATYVDQFADDTIGVSLAASYVDESFQAEDFNAWGYANINGTTVIGGNRSFVTSTQLKRLGLVGTLQWQPSPNVTVTLDGFYSDFEDNQIRRGIELPLGFSVNADDPNTPIDERLVPGFFSASFDASRATVVDGFAVSGRFPTVEGVVRNDPQERNAELISGGFNVAYIGDDGWRATFDFGYSRTDRNELIFESYSGTGFGAGVGALDSIDFTSTTSGTVFDPTLDYSNPSLIRLTDPLGWGGGVIPQAGYFNNRIVDDELKQFKVDIEREFTDSFVSSVRVGLAYTDREKSLTPDEFFIRLPNGQTEVNIPQSALLRSTNIAFQGLGPIVSYDPRGLLDDGVLILQPNTANDVLGKAYTVSEDLLTSYLQVNLDREFGSARLTGNVGVQVIFTDQSSDGIFFPPGAANGVSQDITLGDDYVDVLPSLNLSLDLAGDWKLRFSAAREIQRPRIDDTRVALGYGFDQGQGVIIGGGGNPFLRPFRANAVDFNVEKYFGNKGVIAAQFFYKDLRNFIFQGLVPFDFSALPPPTNLPANAPLQGFLNVPSNTGGGKIYGAELSAVLPFDLLTSALEGFGFTGGVGWTDTEVENDQGDRQRIVGFSKWTANGTLYFEKAGFSLRGSARYRSNFVGELSVFGGARGNRQAVEELIFDGQVGYDFKGRALDGLSLFLQGQNLTDERFSTIADPTNPLSVIDYSIYGRRIFAGFNYKF